MAIVEFLLDHGVDVNANHGMTALHNASAGGFVDLVTLLLARGADLEAVNEFGGSVLSSTVWFAHHLQENEFVERNFPRMFDVLIAAGARTDFYPELLADIERVRRRANGISAG